MKQYTLTIVFSNNMERMLMCFHNKLRQFNFVGGKILPGETAIDASYRELEEETGITRNDISLHTVETINVPSVEHLLAGEEGLDATMVITTGIVNKPVVNLIPEINPLFWMAVDYPIYIDKDYTDKQWYDVLNKAMKYIRTHDCR